MFVVHAQVLTAESPEAVFPCMSSSSALPILYGAAIEALARTFAALPTKATAAATGAAVLLRVAKAVTLMTALILLTKRVTNRGVLLAAIKHGRVFVEAFQKAVPFLGTQLTTQVRRRRRVYLVPTVGMRLCMRGG